MLLKNTKKTVWFPSLFQLCSQALECPTTNNQGSRVLGGVSQSLKTHLFCEWLCTMCLFLFLYSNYYVLLSISPPPPPPLSAHWAFKLMESCAVKVDIIIINNKGTLMHTVLNNNSPNCLAQVCISHQSHYANSRNNLWVPRSRLDLFKTSISFSGAFLPQNTKSCILLPCFNCNMHKYYSENNFSFNLDGLVWITGLSKHLSVVYMYVHKRILIPMFLHIF